MFRIIDELEFGMPFSTNCGKVAVFLNKEKMTEAEMIAVYGRTDITDNETFRYTFMYNHSDCPKVMYYCAAFDVFAEDPKLVNCHIDDLTKRHYYAKSTGLGRALAEQRYPDNSECRDAFVRGFYECPYFLPLGYEVGKDYYDGRLISTEKVSWKQIKPGDVVIEGVLYAFDNTPNPGRCYRYITDVMNGKFRYFENGEFHEIEPFCCVWLVCGDPGTPEGKLVRIVSPKKMEENEPF